MRCRTCDYPLWNLKARSCPECGTGFKPSEFEFRPRSVEYRCPHCDQVYFGTGFQGHLVPDSFQCVQCAQLISMDEMVLRPAGDMSESMTKRDEIPWLQRRTRNWFKCWFATIGMAMAQPFNLMRATPPEDSTSQAWRFALITAFLMGFLGYGVPTMGAALIPWANGDPRTAAGVALAGVVIAIGILILNILLILMWGSVTHVILMLFGGSNERIGRTFEAICYSSGVNAPAIVPCVGPYCLSNVTAVWWIISAILMVKQAHRISGVRATIATLVFPVMLLVLIMVMYLALVFIPIGLAATTGGMGTQMTTAGETQVLTDRLLAYADRNGGVGPSHAAMLLADMSAAPLDFIGSGTGTDPASIQLNEFYTLEDMQIVDADNTAATARQLADALPKDVTAHRLGDFVFVYHGIDFDDDPQELWIVIGPPSAQLGAGANVAVGRLDGTTQEISRITFDLALEDQNAVRAAAGLPPLVDPLGVTHDHPEVANQEPEP